MKKKIYSSTAILCALVLLLISSTNVVAADGAETDIVDMSYEQEILGSDLSAADKEMLIKDSEFEERHNKLKEEGGITGYFC